MKLSDIMEITAATAPNTNSDEGQSDFKKLKSENEVNNFPNRIKLRPVDAHIPDTQHEENWSSLELWSKQQGLVVAFMTIVQWLQMGCLIRGKIKDHSNFAVFVWVCVIFVAIAFIFTWYVARSRYIWCIPGALSSQFCALFVCFFFLVLRLTVVSYDNKEDYQYERCLMWASFFLNFAAALTGWFSVKIMWSIGGYEAYKKIRGFENRYGDIIFEIVNPDQEPPPRAETPAECPQ